MTFYIPVLNLAVTCNVIPDVIHYCIVCKMVFCDKNKILINKMLSCRRGTALHGGLVMAKSGRLEPGDNIYGHYRSIFNHCDVFGQQTTEISEKMQNKDYYTIQGHRGQYKSKPVCDFLLAINSN